jgi:hypothetical protein
MSIQWAISLILGMLPEINNRRESAYSILQRIKNLERLA